MRVMNHVNSRSSGTSIAVSVASLMFAFILLVILSFFGRVRARVAPERAGVPFPGLAGGGQR